MNTRDDAWGGSLENRARLVREVTRAARAKGGAGFLVGVRLSPEDFGFTRGVDLDDHAGEFPRLDERFTGLPYRHGWFMAGAGLVLAGLWGLLAYVVASGGRVDAASGPLIGQPAGPRDVTARFGRSAGTTYS